MIDAPIALAFTAGLVATVNPCGFAMLPAYLSWYLETEQDAGGTTAPSPTLADRLVRALLVGATVSAGFLVVFGITGTLITAGIRSFIDYVPWVAMIIGAAFIGYSNAWVKSNAYYIEGYGYAGRAAYSRFFVDLMIAPIRLFDAEVNGENNFLGGRLGVDNIWGKPTGYSLRAEIGIMPGGLGLYGLLTFGVGSLLGGS